MRRCCFDLACWASTTSAIPWPTSPPGAASTTRTRRIQCHVFRYFEPATTLADFRLVTDRENQWMAHDEYVGQAALKTRQRDSGRQIHSAEPRTPSANRG